MLSYAQNAEDVVLARAFGAQPSGFYLDVGARHPELGSVTKHFYDRGWCGINVTPSPVDHALFCEARPRDVNLRLALSGRAGQVDIARWRHEGGAGLVELEVELPTLADVCARYSTASIDFLRIDLDGSEAEVVRGGDWERDRPRVLVVAATEPGAPGPRAPSWEALLFAVGYQLTLFDGLNRFYVRAEDAALLPRLAVPANTHDAWEPYRYVSKIAELERHAAALALDAAKRGRYALDLQEHFDRCQEWVKVLERKVRRFEEHLGLLPDTLPPPRPRYTAEDFVRFLYAALVNRADPPSRHVAQWADRLRAGTTMLDLFEAFLAMPEGDHGFWIHPRFQRSQHPKPSALATVDATEESSPSG